MNTEIEKLIDLALADGQITEKERGVIINKALALGVDQDEVEMILDARLHQLQNSQILPNKEKVGNIKTCPACGSSVKAFQLKCESCDHEFQNTKIEGYINDFKKTIEKAVSEKHIRYKYTVNNVEHVIPDEPSKEKAIASLIKSYPLPKNKEDIIELLIYSYSNYESVDNQKLWGIGIPQPVKDAWYAKAKQAIELLEVYGEKDQQSQTIIKRYREYFSKPVQSKPQEKSKNNGCLKKALIIAAVFMGIGLIYMLIPLSESDKKSRIEINTFIEQNKLDSAIARINYVENIIEKKKAIDKIFIRALENKDVVSAKKVIKYYDSEYDQKEAMKKIFNLEQK